MKIGKIICIAIILNVLVLSGLSAVKIGITAIVEHPSLDAARNGMQEYLEEMGLKEGTDYEIVYQNAQGNMNTAVAIAEQFVSTGADIIVGISTPSAQACANAAKSVPVVFTAVTDPVSAGLIAKIGKNPGSNVVGVSDMIPVNSHMKLLKLLIADAKKIGVLYNPGESNSVVLKNHAKTACEALGLEMVEITGSNTPEMISAINSVIDGIDAIYVGTDNTVASSMNAISRSAVLKHVPIIAGDIGTAKNGGTIGFGFDYREVGRETGKLVYEIMKGKKAGELESKLVDAESLTLYINLDMAKEVGMEIPESLLAKADYIVKDGAETSR